jgi:hypothetical protein
MTVSSKWYDDKEGFARTYELHYTTSRRASPSTVRRTLAHRGIPDFQQTIYRKYHVRIPPGRIRVSFEREELAEAEKRIIAVLGRTVRYHGKQYMATALPPRVIPYGKKNRRAKTRKGKRVKGR